MRLVGRLVVLALVVQSTVPAVCVASQAEDYFREGFVAATARNWDTAIDLYTKSIELDPGNPEPIFQRAIIYEMKGCDDEAAADYERVLQLRPDYYLAMEYLAKLYERRGEYDKAVELYEKALPLVKNGKWRSIVKWWTSNARKKLRNQRKDRERRNGRARAR